jgi:hypothetical protein
MKTKRSSHLQKKNRPAANQEQLVNPCPRPTEIEIDTGKKSAGDCNGVCAVNWKPATVR